jgi:2-C-methyl-D-erythritol 2,4-cyclodiphosphate synthase
MNLRVGIGYDLHRTGPGRKLVLGGLAVPAEFGLEGFSDADVLTHAVIDAMLGAANLGDIGRHFPPGDARFEDAESVGLLRQTLLLLTSMGWSPVNVDATVIAERPRLAPYIDRMRESLAEAAGMDGAKVSVKAKTNEGVGALGSGDAIACMAVALIQRE